MIKPLKLTKKTVMKEKYINVNGLNIAYVERGEACEKPPIIYLHGWLDNAASFNALAPLIDYPHSIAIDLPGHGHSAHLPSYAYYHFIDGVSQLIETINAFHANKCILIGHSLGACLASIIAGSIPDRIETLILLDAIGPLTTPADESALKYQTYFKQLNALKKKRVRNYASIDSACEHRGASGYLAASFVGPIVERGLKRIDDVFQWRHDPRLLLPSPLKMTEAQTVAFLKEIAAPTLLINASQGFKIKPSDYQPRLDAVSNLNLKTLDCGHHLHVEKPNECANLINDFL